MSEDLVRVDLKGSKDLQHAVENMLQTRGVPVRIVKTERGECLTFPNSPHFLQASLSVFDELRDAVEGTVEVPKSGKYGLDEKGRMEMRLVASQAFQSVKSMKREFMFQPPPARPPSFSEMYQDEVRQILKEVPLAMRSWQSGSVEVKRDALLVLGFVLGVIMLVTGILGYTRVVSGDVVGFLAGAVIGYVFSLLARHLR